MLAFDPTLVALSLAIAIFASFTALNLSARLAIADHAARPFWVAAAAVALGSGIWAMHFVGMLAARMPVAATYDLKLTILSFALPILSSAIGFQVVGRNRESRGPLVAAGTITGLGIVAMHYCGMAAMHVPGVSVSYDMKLVALSVAIAVAAATAALYLGFRTAQTVSRLVASAVMGVAIAGMHYTGMAAAKFAASDYPVAFPAEDIGTAVLASIVTTATAMLMMLGLLTSFFDRKLASLTQREATALRQSEERFRLMIENSTDVIVVLDAAGVVIYASPSASRMLGLSSERIRGRRLCAFAAEGTREEVNALTLRLVRSSGATLTEEIALRAGCGEVRTFEAVGKNLLDEPALTGIVLNLRDVTERKRLMADMEILSETDLLTGAHNRRGFIRTATEEFERLRDSGEDVTVVMIDIDHFKQVNDTYGHAAGDLVISMIAQQCRRLLRDRDIVSRYGGEEFVVLLPDMSVADAKAIVDRLRKAIAVTGVSTIRGEVSVTASFGLARVSPARVDLETALRWADDALYMAKDAGRNCIKMRAA